MKKSTAALLSTLKRRIFPKRSKPLIRGKASGSQSENYKKNLAAYEYAEKGRYKMKKHAGLHWYASLIFLSVRWYIDLLFYKETKVGESGVRYRQDRAMVMKKRYITAITAAIIVTTFVLSVSLFGKGNNVYASSTGETKVQSTASPLPEVTEEPDSKSAVVTYTPEPSKTAAVKDAIQPDSTETIPTPSSETGLNPGSSDPRIADIQTRLMDLGYMDSDQPTDFYGWGTKYSIELFQRKNGLQVDGLIGQQTLTMLFADNAQNYIIKKGDYGSDVKDVQERLTELKYLNSDVTGYFGSDTVDAVRSFQKTNGLNVNGSIDEKTHDALFSDEAKSAPVKNTTTVKKPITKSSKPAASGTPAPSVSPKPSAKPDPSPSETSSPDDSGSKVDKFIFIAKSYLGCRYIRGAKGPNSFDCSGFVYYCLNKAGYKIDYMVSTDWARCSLPKVSKMSDMKAGDIICYSPHHVAIYIGGGTMIDASSSNGKVVQRSCTSDYWQSHFRCARRVF